MSRSGSMCEVGRSNADGDRAYGVV
jgi:hypothetical protein